MAFAVRIFIRKRQFAPRISGICFCSLRFDNLASIVQQHSTSSVRGDRSQPSICCVRTHILYPCPNWSLWDAVGRSSDSQVYTALVYRMGGSGLVVNIKARRASLPSSNSRPLLRLRTFTLVHPLSLTPCLLPYALAPMAIRNTNLAFLFSVSTGLQTNMMAM